MPAILTHDFFGQDAYGEALECVRLFTPDERDAFLLGNQGPDPLFYLAIVPHGMDEFKHLGNELHHANPSGVLVALRRACDKVPDEDRGVAQAYTAGFLCHYLLDSTVHPFVYYWQNGICEAGVAGLDASDGNLVHAEIERDLDEMVLFTKTGQTVATYRPYEQVLLARDRVLDLLGALYAEAFCLERTDNPQVARNVFPAAVKSFRLVQHLFYSPTSNKARVLGVFEKPILRQRYSLCQAMSHRDRAQDTSDFDNRQHQMWEDPFTHALENDSFWDLYHKALAWVGSELPRFMASDFSEDVAHDITHGLNFSGEPVE